ncbi:MAG TPA: helix-turn-helix transcriptional regulator [Phaeodactylibacter sp.]|nr:helix-turn-helix transcriptional regulator [Phaeodactylibacter sp.]
MHGTKKELQILIGKNIRESRNRKNIPAQELASSCDFEKSTIARLEAGNTNPTIFTLYKISEALGVKMEEIVKGV